jgi:Sulfotransferase family
MSRFTDFAKQTFFSAYNRTQGTVSKSTAYVGKNDYDCPLVFMHVPKCGGMSLVNSLIEAIGPSSVLGGFDLTLFGDFVDFHSLDPAIRHAIYINHLPEGAFDFIGGHMALSTLERRFPNARRMTLLRHPTVRLISLYLFWRSLPDEELQRWGSWAERLRLSNGRLLDFLLAKEVSCQTDNLLARFLLWPHPDIPKDGFIDERLHRKLQREATKKLASFEFVDILEGPRLEERIAAWLGVPFRLRRDNETIIRADLRIDLAEDFSPTTERWLRRLTAIDSRLWTAYARKLKGPFGCSRWARRLLADYEERVVRSWRPEHQDQAPGLGKIPFE